ncbi:maternal effect protein oskar [Orussus abietinus]|uniref:maternal effect protein oskar n=1 Tax=Orussus abietinus TaxID=222816 RepID=UPI000625471F|nr:maternal effect protein oskar [Orussus abietinus]
MSFEDTVASLKACIISRKGGVPLEEINSEYEKLVGRSIPYMKLGFTSLFDLLRNIPDIYTKRNEKDEHFFQVVDSATAHIQHLVNKQRSAESVRFAQEAGRKKSGNKKRDEFLSSRWRNSSEDRNSQRRRKTRDVNNEIRSQNRMRSLGRRRNYEKEFGDFNSLWDSEQSELQSYEHGESLIDYEIDVYECSYPVVIAEKILDLNRIFEPVVYGQQLIGDDFFLQLTIRNIPDAQIIREDNRSPIHSGLCISGQTIAGCIEKLKKVKSLTNRITILLGAVDIYMKRSREQLISDMESLLELCIDRFGFSKSTITLCTIPPLANISLMCHPNQFNTLLGFNSWIKSISCRSTFKEMKSAYRLIDFFTAFTGKNMSTDYKLFQMEARMVSGCSSAHVLWSKTGRKKAINLLRLNTIRMLKSEDNPNPYETEE